MTQINRGALINTIVLSAGVSRRRWRNGGGSVRSLRPHNRRNTSRYALFMLYNTIIQYKNFYCGKFRRETQDQQRTKTNVLDCFKSV